MGSNDILYVSHEGEGSRVCFCYRGSTSILHFCLCFVLLFFILFFYPLSNLRSSYINLSLPLQECSEMSLLLLLVVGLAW